jgi:hypothetical protein
LQSADEAVVTPRVFQRLSAENRQALWLEASGPLLSVPCEYSVFLAMEAWRTCHICLLVSHRRVGRCDIPYTHHAQASVTVFWPHLRIPHTGYGS